MKLGLILLTLVACTNVHTTPEVTKVKTLGKANVKICEEYRRYEHGVLCETKTTCHAINGHGFTGYDFLGTIAGLFARAKGWF